MTPKLYTIDDIRLACVGKSHFFDKETMRWWKTRVSECVFQGHQGVFFVTSDKPGGNSRSYTVRRFDPEKCTIEAASKFGAFATLKQAKAWANRIRTTPPDDSTPHS